MANADRQPSGFDERAAEEELERIRTALEECRRRRTEAAESFDAFLRSFSPVGREQTPVEPQGDDRRAGSAAADPPPTYVVVAPPAASSSSSPLSAEQHDATGPEDQVAPSAATKVFDFGRMQQKYVFAAVAIIAVGTAMVLWLMKSPDADPVPTAVPAASAPAFPAPQPAATPQATAGSNQFRIELVTIRHVWLRVVVDGERTMEQEVPADQRIVLTPKQTATIRAGDAGAVVVAVNGKDTGPIGIEGLPRTKTFNRPD